ncbi:MAG: methyl-accepting chemotaxis protein [Gammaproteobacteria bacterium]|nr:methyl-accepting chemotaxis protein [Gammaproteobacteria bacterium]
MKLNTPVTDHEISLSNDHVIVSKTNLKGIITYVNKDFIEISGYTEKELIGINHNLVRHPDMPAIAFQDLWDTIKLGKPWTGIVKNRAKNGDYYWVEANVTPITKNGHISEYLSVRRKPTSQQVKNADDLYHRLNAGKIPRPSILQKLSALKSLSLMKKFYILMLFMAISFALSGVFAWTPMNLIGGHWFDYQEHVLKRQTLQKNIMQQFGYGGAIHQFKNYVLRGAEKHKQQFEENHLQLKQTITTYRALEDIQPEELQALIIIESVANDYASMLEPIKAMIRDGNTAMEIDGRVKISDAPAIEALKKLDTVFIQRTEKVSADIKQILDIGSKAVAIMPVIGFILLFSIFWLSLRYSIINPLEAVRGIFKNIAEGKLFNDIDISSGDEIGRVRRELKSMQIKLSYDMNESSRLVTEGLRIKTALDNVSTSVMLADDNRNILYVNKTLHDILQNAESDIQKDLPNFNADKLLGESIDQFHKKPEHQKGILARLTTEHRARVNLGGRSFDLVVNPVVDKNGKREGTAVEWADVTEQLIMEQEIDRVVNAVAKGELQNRINLENKEGFIRNLGQGVNEMTHVVNDSIKEVEEVLSSMATGDLTHNVSTGYSGAFGNLANSANDTINKLKDIVQKIRTSAENINTASSEISQGNSDLSSRTEQQASSLEETASSMEELTSTVKQNSDNANNADKLAMGARTQAQHGGEIVGRAINAMSAINESSGKIADIISVIDEIAFQTNLLALNASVEAARAGDQGRGFAVVASEVRNLAQRSATAAKQIKDLISDSVVKVKDGSQLVNESGVALEEIVKSVNQVSEIVANIATASQEQTLGIEQINKAIMSMDEMTQQNAALVEEAAAASESLDQQAGELTQLVGYFNTMK